MCTLPRFDEGAQSNSEMPAYETSLFQLTVAVDTTSAPHNIVDIIDHARSCSTRTQFVSSQTSHFTCGQILSVALAALEQTVRWY